MPTTETASATVHQTRHEICEILGGRDRRLLEPLVYGQSITDACMGWDETLELLAGLAKAVRSGR